jgi:hypothetical protein
LKILAVLRFCRWGIEWRLCEDKADEKTEQTKKRGNGGRKKKRGKGGRKKKRGNGRRKKKRGNRRSR